MESFDGVGRSEMKPLPAGLRDAGQQRLANQFVGKFKGRLGILGTGDD